MKQKQLKTDKGIQERLIRIRELAEKMSIAQSTVWLYVNQGRLPKPIKLSARVSVWKESEIDAIIISL